MVSGAQKCIRFGSRLEKGKRGIKVFYFTGIALQLVLNKTAVENYVEYSIFQLKHGLPTVAYF